MVAKTRVAQCACGGISATAEGEPDLVVLCNCVACQRRTGSPFGVGAYYKRGAVTLTGVSKTFVRKVEGSDRIVTNHFCPDCGGTVYWTLDLRPQHIGIGVGSFGDPAFNPPMRSVWTESKHEWITLPDHMPAFPRAAT